MTSFADLFRVCGSDKQGLHDYGEVYDRLFPADARAGVTAVLELGAGPSLRAWQAAFPNAAVGAVDANAGAVCERWALDPRAVAAADLGDPAVFDRVCGDGRYDLVVDDASHLLAHQLVAWAMLLPRVKPGGWLVIEDVQSEADLAVLRRLPGAVVHDRRASGRYDDLIVAFSGLTPAG